MSTLRIAWRNLGRNRKRTALALVAIAIAQWAVLASDGLMNGYVAVMLDVITGPLVGHVQIHDPEWREDRALDLVIPDAEEKIAAIRADPGVARISARIYAPALVALEEDAVAALVMGVDPAAESALTGLLASVPPADLPGERRVVVGHLLAEKLGVTVGAELAVIGQGVDGSIANDLFMVSAIAHTPVDLLNRLGVVMALETAQELLVMEDEVHEIVVHAGDVEEAGALATRLAANPALAGTEVLDWKGVVPALVTILEMADISGLIMLVLVFIAAAAGVANTMMMATFERTHELGMLRALGCGSGRVVQMLVTESVVLGITGVAIGSVLGMIFVGVTSYTGLDLTGMGSNEVTEMAYEGITISFKVFPKLKAMDVVSGVLAVVLTSLVASIWPALHAARIQPVEAMRA